MLIAGAMERVEQVVSVRADASASASSLTSAMRSISELRSFLAAAEADLAVRLRAVSSFPEPEIAEVSRESLSAASRVIERGETLSAVAGLADALDDARLTAGHVDAVTRGAKALEPEQREALFDRVEGLVSEAGGLSVAEFARRVRREADAVRTDDGMAKLERQRRATSMSTWTDDEGMWNVRGRFDPVTALSVSTVLDRAVETLFAEAVPESCPSDPIEKQKHLRALAFARLVTGAAVVEWPIPIEVPGRVLAALVADADVHAVVGATASCCMLRAPSTSGGRPGWRTGRNDERCVGCTPRARSLAAAPGTTGASCITWCGGVTAAEPIWTTCCRCVSGIITTSTTTAGKYGSAPTGN